MSGNRKQIDIWAVVDCDGEYEVGTDEDEALERFEENISGCGPNHVVHLKLGVPLPRAIEVAGELPEQATGEYALEIQETDGEDSQ